MVYSKRFERKYIIDFYTYKKLKEELKPYFKFDEHGNENGEYIVSSLYYDSRDFRAYREKVDGEKKRSKVRLRTYKDFYGNRLMPKNMLLLEIKKRDNLNVSKKKVMMSTDEAISFIKNPILNKNLLNKYKKRIYALTEAAQLKTLYDIKPAVIVTYTRQAFINKFSPQIRITFDKNVKYRGFDFDVHNINCREYALDPRLIVLEIKYNEILPIWVSNIIGKYSLKLNTFGKYCTSVERMMDKREEFINRVIISKNSVLGVYR